MSEAAEEIQRLTNEVERLQAVDADREKYFALLKERKVELDRQLAGMTEARDRFCGSLNRLADIVGLSGKQCFAPEAVERKAKFELATLRARVNDLEGKRFPIQGGPSIPWSMIGPHDRQCRENHAQTLEDLAKRGGLSPAEAIAVLDDLRWAKSKWGGFTCEGKGDHPKERAARDELERRRAAFEDETVTLQARLKAAEEDDNRRAADDDKQINALWVRLKEARDELCELVAWRVNVTAALHSEGGALYEDVPRLATTLRERVEGLKGEIDRLKKAAVGCDHRIMGCPVVTPEEADLLDPVEAYIETAPGTDFGNGIVDEMGVPFPECSEMAECPNKDCHHYEPEDNSCGRRDGGA